MGHAIPKKKVAIRMLLDNGEQLEGSVFVELMDAVHRGEQTLLDMFNGEARWLPVLTVEGVRLVNRIHILTIEPGPGIEAHQVRRESAVVFRRERVTVTVAQRSLDGCIEMDLPSQSSRVTDFLNFEEEFFSLDTEAGPVIISKRNAVMLTPHEKPPPAPGSEQVAAKADAPEQAIEATSAPRTEPHGSSGMEAGAAVEEEAETPEATPVYAGASTEGDATTRKPGGFADLWSDDES